MKLMTYVFVVFCFYSCNNVEKETTKEFEDGTTQVERFYVHKGSKTEFKYVEYYKNGNVKFEGYIKDGYYRGVKKNFYENGNPKEFIHLKDSGKFNFCCPDGFYELFYENGKINQTHYKLNEKILGKILNYDSTGLKTNDLTVIDNVKNGIAHQYYPSGEIYSIEYYSNNKLLDSLVELFKTGDTAFIANIIDGKINFPIKKCNQNGYCIYGDYLNGDKKKVNWTWVDLKNEIIKTKILTPSDSGFVIPDI